MKVALLGEIPPVENVTVSRKLGGWVGIEGKKARLLSRRAYRSIRDGRFSKLAQPSLRTVKVPIGWHKDRLTLPKSPTKQNVSIDTVMIVPEQYGIKVSSGAYNYYSIIDTGRAMIPVPNVISEVEEECWFIWGEPTIDYEYDVTRGRHSAA